MIPSMNVDMSTPEQLNVTLLVLRRRWQSALLMLVETAPYSEAVSSHLFNFRSLHSEQNYETEAEQVG